MKGSSHVLLSATFINPSNKKKISKIGGRPVNVVWPNDGPCWLGFRTELGNPEGQIYQYASKLNF